MPLYEYRCSACGKEFEVIQKFSDPPLSECPDCGSQVEKLISSTSFVLKGGGWYKDGYASSSSASGDNGNANTTASATASEKKSSTSSGDTSGSNKTSTSAA